MRSTWVSGGAGGEALWSHGSVENLYALAWVSVSAGDRGVFTRAAALLALSYQSPTTQSVHTRVPLEDIKKAAANVARLLAGE